MTWYCSFCGGETEARVLDTRGHRRRRECVECKNTFSSIEVLAKQRKSPTHYPAGHPPDRVLCKRQRHGRGNRAKQEQLIHLAHHVIDEAQLDPGMFQAVCGVQGLLGYPEACEIRERLMQRAAAARLPLDAAAITRALGSALRAQQRRR